MARSFRTGRAAHIVGSKRLTSWFQFTPTATAMSATGGTVLFTLNAAALALRPFTVVRTRFLMGILSDQVVADELQVAAVGMAIVSDQASAIGVTAVPTPITDLSSDLWFQHQMLYSNFTFITGAGFDQQGMVTYEVDSKAMRKVDIGQDLVVVGERGGAGDGVIVVVGGRMLVKVN